MNNIFKKIAFGAIALLVVSSYAIVPLSAHADTSKEKAPGSSVEIQITGNGNALVRGAKVTSLSSTSISATTLVASTTLAWTVKTNDQTVFLRQNGGRATSSEISVGDIISFNGSIDSGVGLFTVNAKTVKDWSITKNQTLLSGSVLSVNIAQSSFSLLDEKQGTTTVTVATNTPIVKDGNAILFSLLKVGDKVKASGVYNDQTKVLVAGKITVNFKMENGEYERGFKGFFKLWGDKIRLQFDKKDKDNDD